MTTAAVAANPAADTDTAAAYKVFANPVTRIHSAEVTPEVAAVARWVAALRETDVDQGQSYLMQDTPYGQAFCCLGLACDISDEGQWGWLSANGPGPEVANSGYYVYLIGADSSREAVGSEKDNLGCLPEVIRKRLGLRTNLGHFRATPAWFRALNDANPRVADALARYLAEACGAAFDDNGWLLAETTASLTGLNDDGDMNFTDIAAVIDSRPPGLFTW